MLPVGQVQPAEHELGLGAVMRELTALLRGEQARQRGKIVFLKELEQHFAISEVLHDDAGIVACSDRVGRRQREQRLPSRWRDEPPPATPTP